MRRAAFILLCVLPPVLAAQTLNVVTGSVKYQIPASQAGNMYYSDDIINILGKQFAIADITDMYVDETEVEDSSVGVVYSDTSAAVVVAGNCMQYLTVEVAGANVVIEQAEDLDEEITYSLSGSSADGSFYMNGKLKATVELNNLTLTSSTTAPINIRNGKRIKLCLIGTSTLADNAASDGKGTLMVNGHSEIEGDGTLNLYGYARHAYWADEYILLKKSFAGAINILYAAEDGINVNEYFEQRSGTVAMAIPAAGGKGVKATGEIIISNEAQIDITATGDAYYDTSDRDIKGVACLSSDTNVTISGGNITLSATGKGGKGIKADDTFTMDDGTLTVTTTGTRFTYNRETSSPKGVRAGTKASSTWGTPTGNLVINGGTINVTTSGQEDGSEGIESKSTLYIYGGDITITAYDDAINSARDMYIYGGQIETVSTTNDGLDSNANLYIYDGTVAAYASIESSLDAAEMYNLYLHGGVIIGVGSMSITPASSSAQAYVTTTGTVTANTTVSLTSNNQVLCSFVVPANYTDMGGNQGGNQGGIGGNQGGIGGNQGGIGGNQGGIGGNQGGIGGNMGGYQIVISCPELSKGSSYTLTTGSTTTTVTAR